MGLSTSTAATPSRAVAAQGVAATSAGAPSRGLRWYALGVLAYNVGVILDGALVRATGSGNGCGDHWPLCNGEIVQQHPKITTIIEYAHRATSGIALLAVIGLVVWVFRGTARRHLARVAAVVSLVFILNEAVLGALLVLLGMTAQNESPARAFYLSLHLTNTLLMLAALAVTAHFLSREQGYMRGSVELRRWALAATGLLAVIVTGVTGSLAALADTLHPATNLAAAFAQDFSAHSDWLVRIRWFHPAVSAIAGLFVAVLALASMRYGETRRLGAGLIALLVVQYALGLGDLVLLTPLSLQILHLLGADLVWIALVVLAARLCVRPIGCTAISCG
ncbi:MAG TPA: COX15/CtaA family protein [Acidobacteriaceae bacterium]|nr:COX15/CtaA family protein [Acidobacteriaceae bacterium]